MSLRHPVSHTGIFIFTQISSTGWNTGTGWLRLVGSLKLWVFIAHISLFCRALLQKRPVILRSLRSVATPYFCKKKQIWPVVDAYVHKRYICTYYIHIQPVYVTYINLHTCHVFWYVYVIFTPARSLWVHRLPASTAATHCNTLQHTELHCNALEHIDTH